MKHHLVKTNSNLLTNTISTETRNTLKRYIFLLGLHGKF